MSMKQELLDVSGWAGVVERDLIAGLSDQVRGRRGSPQRWSAKDVIGHVTAWRQNMLQSFWAHEPPAGERTPEELQSTNAFIFEAYHDLSWAEIEGLARAAREAIHLLIADAGEQELIDPKRFPWLNGQTLWRRVIGNLVVHPMTHFAQLMTELGRKEDSCELQVQTADRLMKLDSDPAWQGETRYNLACAYALSGRKDQAIAGLRQALSLRPDLTDWSKQDPDFQSLRDDPDFQAVYTR